MITWCNQQMGIVSSKQLKFLYKWIFWIRRTFYQTFPSSGQLNHFDQWESFLPTFISKNNFSAFIFIVSINSYFTPSKIDFSPVEYPIRLWHSTSSIATGESAILCVPLELVTIQRSSNTGPDVATVGAVLMSFPVLTIFPHA